MLKIGILGFGKVARNLISKVRTYPEYDGENVYIYNVTGNRNTLSYGPDHIVEIPDIYGDGYRTYNDGFQGMGPLRISISDYRDWFVGELKEGAFNVVVDAAPYSEEHSEYVLNLIRSAPTNQFTFYLTSKELCEKHLKEILDAKSSTNSEVIFSYVDGGSVEDVTEKISEGLRYQLDGGMSWTPVQFSEEFMAEAQEKAKEAAKVMWGYHLKNRQDIVDRELASGRVPSTTETSKATDMYEDSDLQTLERFVLNGDTKYGYKRVEYYDDEHKCKVIEHEMLEWFFGANPISDLGAKAFLIPNLKVSSARYLIYDSPESKVPDAINGGSCGYAVEYIVKQDDNSWKIHMDVLSESPQELNQGEAYAYQAGVGKVTRGPMGDSNNKEVHSIVYHLTETDSEGNPRSCNCFNKKSEELKFAQEGEPCGFESSVDWSKYEEHQS